jgi:predicted DNA-binding transcriptional regulator YafY
LRSLAVDLAEYDAEWDLLSVPYIDGDRLVDDVLPYGADVVVVDPEEARTAVIRRLRSLVATP